MKVKVKRIISQLNKKSFTVKILEETLIERLGGESSYDLAGGYKTFAGVILLLESEGFIRAVKSASFYYKKPYIKEKYIRNDKNVKSQWDMYTFLSFSDLLDLSYFRKHKGEQNDLNLMYLKRIYEFIKNREHRLLASQEERCLELFDDEKYLSAAENILKKVKLNSNLEFSNFDEGLKMEKYTQMFVFFENKGINNQKVLIIENQSTFFTVKKILAEKGSFLKEKYQFIIWGQGKGIIKQLEMLSKIIDPTSVTIHYFGDMDPEGYFIFLKLREKFSKLNITLLDKAYKILMDEGKFYRYDKEQAKKDRSLEEVLTFFHEEKYKRRIEELWEKNLRIPQEVITYELMKRCETNGYL